MTTQTELLRFGLTALLTGLAIPIAVQLFLVLRSIQKVTATLDRRLDQTLREAGDLVSEFRRSSVPVPSLVSQLAAVVPAVIPAVMAAVHAFRAGLRRTEASDPPPSHPPTKENAA